MKKLRLLIFVMTICINTTYAQSTSLSDEQLVTYSMDKYWNESAVAKTFEDMYALKMIEAYNNYASREYLFVQIHSVCQGSKFLGNVYSISYRDKDHLGKLRIFLSENLALNSSAGQQNKNNITTLEKNHTTFPDKFDPIEGLQTISKFGIVGKNKCGQ